MQKMLESWFDEYCRELYNILKIKHEIYVFIYDLLCRKNEGISDMVSNHDYHILKRARLQHFDS